MSDKQLTSAEASDEVLRLLLQEEEDISTENDLCELIDPDDENLVVHHDKSMDDSDIDLDVETSTPVIRRQVLRKKLLTKKLLVDSIDASLKEENFQPMNDKNIYL